MLTLLAAGLFVGNPLLATVSIGQTAASTAPTLPQDSGQAPADRPAPPLTNWRTPEDLPGALRQTMSVQWTGVPLRSVLQSISRSNRVAIFLDRRVDPDQLVDFAASDTRLDAIVQKLAASANLAVGLIGPVIYVGPPDTAARVATVVAMQRDLMKKLPGPTARRMARRRTVAWPRLSQPSEIVADLAGSYSLEISNLAAMPYDLWSVGDLPALDLPEAMTLLLAGFQMSYKVQENGKTAGLTVFPKAVWVERRYRVGESKVNDVATELAKQYPQAFVSVETPHVVVRTTAEDHAALQQRFGGSVSKPSDREPKLAQPKKQVYTFKVTNQPVGKLLQVLGKRLGLKIELDESAKSVLDHRVTVSVTNASLTDVLDALTKPAGLTYQQNGNDVVISK